MSKLNETDRTKLLDALQALVLEIASPALDRTLGAVDDYLFDRSQNGEEDLGLMALRDLRRARSGIAGHFVQAVDGGFARLRHQARSGAVQEAPAGLSLLSDHDLEEQLAVEQLAASVLRVHAPAFELAGKRLVELVGGVVDESDDPLGPAFLARAVANALDQHELDRNLHIVILKFFERELGPVMGLVFDRGNALMASAGILRDLRPSGPRPPPAAGQQEPAAAAGAAEGAPHAAFANAAPTRGGASFGEQMQAGAADQALFASMLGMLQAWRGQVPGLVGASAAAGQPAGPALGTTDLMSVLSLMQRDAAASMPVPGAGNGGSLAAQLRQQMAQSARKLGVAGDNLHLDGLDSDAVDLVALLFDVLLDGPQYDANIRRMIGRMLVPYVKVAVQDRRLFLYKEHPARRLLNTVAEACEGNHGEAPQERELLGRVDQTIDRLVAEFNEDVAIFETLEQELREYLAQHRRRFELAEKRSAEAQRGRERLQHARATVAAELALSRGGRDLPPVIAGFLDRHAAHHLAQVMLREGRDSARYRSAKDAVDSLLIAFDWAHDGGASDTLKPLPEGELEAIFASSGCAGSAAQAAIDALHAALARIAEGQTAAARAIELPAAAAVPEPAPLPPEPVPALEEAEDGLDYDAGTLVRTEALNVGDWLQLVQSTGNAEPAKVSWISPISGRLLLVNRRGIRVLVASPRELAAMAKLGKLQLRTGETAFEDAMHQMVDRLKSTMPA